MNEEAHTSQTPVLLLDRYRIDGMLGEGGLGTVYKAYDTRLKRTVAIKTLKRSVYTDDPDMYRRLEERFQREAEAGSRMHVHPNLVVVHDFVADADKSLYLVQEFVPGGTLADRLAKEGALPQSEALRLTAEVAGQSHLNFGPTTFGFWLVVPQFLRKLCSWRCVSPEAER